MEPQTNQPPQAQTPHNEVHTGKSKDPLKMWVVLFGALLLVATGIAIWQALQASSLNSKVSSLEKSADDLQNSNSALQSELDLLKGIDTSGSESDPDTVKILAAVDAYVRAPKGVVGDFKYSITKNNGSFAKVNVAEPEGGGYLAWLKKVDDNWTVILTGQDMPAQADLDKYAIPADF